MCRDRGYAQLPARPLDFFDNVKTAVEDELVQVARLLGEARLAIATLLARAKLVLEQRIVLGADYGEVVAHRLDWPCLCVWCLLVDLLCRCFCCCCCCCCCWRVAIGQSSGRWAFAGGMSSECGRVGRWSSHSLSRDDIQSRQRQLSGG